MSAIPPAAAQVIQAQQSAVKSEIATAIAGKHLDAAEQQGEAIVALLEDAAALSKEAGKGQRFDGVA